MPLDIPCPHCQAVSKLKEEHRIGTSAKCPGCQRAFRITVPADPLGSVDPLDPLGENVASHDPLEITGSDSSLGAANLPSNSAPTPRLTNVSYDMSTAAPAAHGMPQSDFHLTPPGRSSLQDEPDDATDSSTSRMLWLAACAGAAIGVVLLCGGMIWMAGSVRDEHRRRRLARTGRRDAKKS